MNEVTTGALHRLGTQSWVPLYVSGMLLGLCISVLEATLIVGDWLYVLVLIWPIYAFAGLAALVAHGRRPGLRPVILAAGVAPLLVLNVFGVLLILAAGVGYVFHVPSLVLMLAAIGRSDRD
jgi:hypothetical protein